MKNLKITKSNAIVNASYRLSLNELRIVLFGLSHINPNSSEFSLFHRVNIKELAEFYDIGEKDRGSFYDNIKTALITKFWEREFSYFDEERGETVKRRWLIEVRHGRKDGTLAYHYNPMLKEQLQQLANRFTSYFLSNVANMKSIYGFRIYEISIMYLNASNKTKTVFNKKIDGLKEHLGLGDKYKRFCDFKLCVLEKAKKEINYYSDIKISYKIKKFGRTPHEITFTVSKKEPDKKLPQLPKETFNLLSTAIVAKAKNMTLKAETGWEINVIEQQFYDYIAKKGQPDNLDGAFIGFVKKKVAQSP